MSKRIRSEILWTLGCLAIGSGVYLSFVAMPRGHLTKEAPAHVPARNERMWTATVQTMTQEEVLSGARSALATLAPDQKLDVKWERTLDGFSRIQILDQSGRQCGLMLANYTPLSFSLNERWEASQGGASIVYSADELRLVAEKRLDSLLPEGIDILHRSWSVTESGGGFTAKLRYILGRNGVPFLDRLSSATLTIDSRGRTLRFVQGGPFERVSSAVKAVGLSEAKVKLSQSLSQLLKRHIPVEEIVVLNGWVEGADGQFRLYYAGRLKPANLGGPDSPEPFLVPNNVLEDWDRLRAWLDNERDPTVFLVDGVKIGRAHV